MLLHIVLLKCPHVQIAFLKFTSCDNRALIGCIPIAAVAVPLNQKSSKIGQSSHKMYSNNILNLRYCWGNLYLIKSCTNSFNKHTHTHTHTHSLSLSFSLSLSLSLSFSLSLIVRPYPLSFLIGSLDTIQCPHKEE